MPAFSLAQIVVEIRGRRQRSLPHRVDIRFDRVRRQVAFEERHASGHAHRRRRHETTGAVEPCRQRRPVPRERQRRTGLDRHRHHLRHDGELGPHLVGQRRRREPDAAVAGPRRRRSIGHVGDRRVLGARHVPSQGAVVPRVGDHAVRLRRGARADRGVAGAGRRARVPVRGFRVVRPFVEQAAQPVSPLVSVLVDVIAAELVHDQQHDQGRTRRAIRRRRGGLRSRQPGRHHADHEPEHRPSGQETNSLHSCGAHRA